MSAKLILALIAMIAINTYNSTGQEVTILHPINKESISDTVTHRLPIYVAKQETVKILDVMFQNENTDMFYNNNNLFYLGVHAYGSDISYVNIGMYTEKRANELNLFDSNDYRGCFYYKGILVFISKLFMPKEKLNVFFITTKYNIEYIEIVDAIYLLNIISEPDKDWGAIYKKGEKPVLTRIPNKNFYSDQLFELNGDIENDTTILNQIFKENRNK